MEKTVAQALFTIAFIGFIVLLKCSVIALSVWFAARWPEKCDRIYTVYQAKPWRCGLIGLVNTTVLIVIGLVLMNVKPLGLLGLLLIVSVAYLHLWGRFASYRTMAETLTLKGSDTATPASLALGGLVTELTFLVPVIGQVLYLGTTLRAMGAVVMVLLARQPAVDEIANVAEIVEE